MTIKLPMGVEIEMNTRLPYDFDDIIRKIFKEYLGEAKTENLAFDKLNFIENQMEQEKNWHLPSMKKLKTISKEKEMNI